MNLKLSISSVDTAGSRPDLLVIHVRFTRELDSMPSKANYMQAKEHH